PRSPESFPTRRSSDLGQVVDERGGRRLQRDPDGRWVDGLDLVDDREQRSEGCPGLFIQNAFKRELDVLGCHRVTVVERRLTQLEDRKSTRLNSSHEWI